MAKKRVKIDRTVGPLDRLAEGCSFAFVLFIAVSLISAALWRRDETDWTLILPTVVALSLFVPIRLAIEKRVRRSCRRQYLSRRRQQCARVESNARLREEAMKLHTPYHYDDDGNLIFKAR